MTTNTASQQSPVTKKTIGRAGDGFVDGVPPRNDLLIAAAPELLEVLKAAVAHSDSLSMARGRTGERLYQAARAAIAKAEGRS